MHFVFNWETDLRDLIRLAVAYLLALPVGWYREKETHSVGLRTFPLVALGSCAFVLVGLPSDVMTREASSRIIQGLVAGIGFIGGGAIVKSENHVHGTAVAASIWTTAALGASVALNRYLLAVALSLLNLLTLRLLLPLKQKVGNGDNGQ